MKGTGDTFPKQASWLPETATERSMVHHYGWIVSTPHFAMRCTEGGRYLPGDEARKDEKLRKERRNYSEFYQTRYVYTVIFSAHNNYKVISHRKR